MFANRTIFEGDNLDVMRGMNDGCVDLIYLDPPFNSNARVCCAESEVNTISNGGVQGHLT